MEMNTLEFAALLARILDETKDGEVPVFIKDLSIDKYYSLKKITTDEVNLKNGETIDVLTIGIDTKEFE